MTSGTSGTTILATMSIATALCTALIAGFCVLGAWWLLPVVIVALLGVTGGIVAFLVHAMGEEDGELTPEPH
jgi:fatty acid desaturase